MTKHIGIVACSAEGAALCYRTICIEGARLLGGHDQPEISMHSQSLGDYMRCIDNNDWAGVGEIMLASAEKLSKCGADFLICPDNTIHQALPYIQDRLPLPWLHIADVVADEAVCRGYACIGLTGTQWLVESDVYPQRFEARGLRYVRPTPEDRIEISRIIMDELVMGIFNSSSVDKFRQVIEELKGMGADSVALGCTEIPLIINDSNSPLPTLDSTRLLALAALRKAMDQ